MGRERLAMRNFGAHGRRLTQVAIPWLLAVGVGCGSSPDPAAERVGTIRQALTPQATRTLGFESLADWSALWSNPVLALSSTHSEGASSLALRGGGWMQVTSRRLSKEEPAPNVVGFDIRVPENPVNPWWSGAAELFIDAPSVGIWGHYVGHVGLTPIPTGQFKRVEFSIPQQLKKELNSNYSDLTIRIVVNVPNNESAAYLLDRFTFGLASNTCTPQPDGNPCTDDVCLNGTPAWPPRSVGSTCDSNTSVCDGSGSCNASAQCVLNSPPPSTTTIPARPMLATPHLAQYTCRLQSA